MMRSLSIVVAFIYVVLSTGVHVHIHYCQEKLADLSLLSGDDCCHHSEAGNCSDHDHCCDFEEVVIVLDEDHITPPQVEFQPLIIPDISSDYSFDIHQIADHLLLEGPSYNKGSPPSYPSIYKLTQSYIYYG